MLRSIFMNFNTIVCNTRRYILVIIR